MKDRTEEIFGKPISIYTRAQAIEDGCLVDLTEAKKDGEDLPLVRQAGFTVPVAMTRAAYETTIAIGGTWEPAEDGEGQVLKLPGCQDVIGRLWDVLWMLKLAISRNRNEGLVSFEVRVNENGRGKLRVHKLISTITGGDDGEPVITIMCMGED